MKESKQKNGLSQADVSLSINGLIVLSLLITPMLFLQGCVKQPEIFPCGELLDVLDKQSFEIEDSFIEVCMTLPGESSPLFRRFPNKSNVTLHIDHEQGIVQVGHRTLHVDLERAKRELRWREESLIQDDHCGIVYYHAKGAEPSNGTCGQGNWISYQVAQLNRIWFNGFRLPSAWFNAESWAGAELDSYNDSAILIEEEDVVGLAIAPYQSWSYPSAANFPGRVTNSSSGLSGLNSNSPAYIQFSQRSLIDVDLSLTTEGYLLINGDTAITESLNSLPEIHELSVTMFLK